MHCEKDLKRDCCPVCGNFKIIIGDDYAYCDKCNWGEKSYQLDITISDTSKAVEGTIDKIQEYLVFNECIVNAKNVQKKFSNINGLDMILVGMEVRNLIKTFYTADGECYIALTGMVGKKVDLCDWVDIEVSFSTDVPPENMQHYRIPCRLSDEMRSELRQDIEAYASNWIKSL